MEMPSTRLKSNAWSLLPWMGMLVAAGLVFVLARDVQGLRPQADELKRRKVLPYVGQWVPTVQAKSLDGQVMTVGETSPGRTQVLFFFTASCPYCRRTVPEWKAVHAALQKNSTVDVVWLSLSSRDSTEVFVREHGIAAPVVRVEDHKALRLFRVKVVPVTLVIDHRGEITHMHGGVIASPAVRDSIVRAARTASPIVPSTPARGAQARADIGAARSQ